MFLINDEIFVLRLDFINDIPRKNKNKLNSRTIWDKLNRRLHVPFRAPPKEGRRVGLGARVCEGGAVRWLGEAQRRVHGLLHLLLGLQKLVGRAGFYKT